MIAAAAKREVIHWSPTEMNRPTAFHRLLNFQSERSYCVSVWSDTQYGDAMRKLTDIVKMVIDMTKIVINVYLIFKL